MIAGYLRLAMIIISLYNLYKVVPPSYVSWFIIPINYRYNPLINPSEIGLINQLS